MQAGFFVDILMGPFSCFDASRYGTLLIADPEEGFFEAELEKLKRDVSQLGLSVVIFAEWHSTLHASDVAFFDDNTKASEAQGGGHGG